MGQNLEEKLDWPFQMNRKEDPKKVDQALGAGS